MKRYLTGSCLFFRNFPEFKPHDIDYCELDDNQIEIRKKVDYDYGDIYRYKRLKPEEYIQYALLQKPWVLTQFLTPGFCKEVGFSIEHLKQLKYLRDQLPESHKYELIIYDSFIENNDWFLTKELLLKAFDEYIKTRKEKSFIEGIYNINLYL